MRARRDEMGMQNRLYDVLETRSLSDNLIATRHLTAQGLRRFVGDPLRLRMESSRPQKGCAQAPQPRRDDKGCAAGLSPHALLFATRSPMRKEKITQIRKVNSCRSHQWSDFDNDDIRDSQIVHGNRYRMRMSDDVMHAGLAYRIDFTRSSATEPWKTSALGNCMMNTAPPPMWFSTRTLP